MEIPLFVLLKFIYFKKREKHRFPLMFIIYRYEVYLFGGITYPSVTSLLIALFFFII